MRIILLLLLSGFINSLLGQADTIPPVIILKGPNPMFICDTLQTSFAEYGAIVTDNSGSANTAITVYLGDVRLNQVGTYTVTYTATDTSGNTSKAYRIVKVGHCYLYGNGFYDDNQNCMKDSNEERNMRYKLVLRHLGTSNTTTIFSDNYGAYMPNTLADTGDYMVYVYSLSPAFLLINCLKDSFLFHYSYQKSVKIDLPFFDSVSANVKGFISSPLFHRHGYADSIYVHVENTRQLNVTGVQCKLKMPAGSIAIQYPNITIDSSRNRTLYWHIDTLKDHTSKEYKFRFSADTSDYKLGDTIAWSFSVKCNEMETDSSDNSDQLAMQVVSSYDPNIKSCNQPNILPSGATAFTYRIDFQNTGNAEALVVAVTDTLDPRFDISSLRVKSASHPYELMVRNNILYMKFYSIHLPDSHTNQAQSHGYFVYSLNLKKPLGPTETLRNTAYIYFDNNAPIVTNTVINQYAKTGIRNAALAGLPLYPNPARTLVSFPNKNHETAELSDITGNVILKTSGTVVDVSALPSGLYLMRVGTRVAKLIKE